MSKDLWWYYERLGFVDCLSGGFLGCCWGGIEWCRNWGIFKLWNGCFWMILWNMFFDGVGWLNCFLVLYDYWWIDFFWIVLLFGEFVCCFFFVVDLCLLIVLGDWCIVYLLLSCGIVIFCCFCCFWCGKVWGIGLFCWVVFFVESVDLGGGRCLWILCLKIVKLVVIIIILLLLFLISIFVVDFFRVWL